MTKMIKTTLCYIFKGDSVLMLLRNKKKNDLNEGKWVGVGGKFEDGETPDECLLREVFEETGLTLRSWHLHGIVKFISDKWEDEDMYLYSADEFEGELSDCSEGELAWIPRAEVMSLNLWEGDRYFMEPLLAGEKEINLSVEYQGDTLVEVKKKTSRE